MHRLHCGWMQWSIQTFESSPASAPSGLAPLVVQLGIPYYCGMEPCEMGYRNPTNTSRTDYGSLTQGKQRYAASFLEIATVVLCTPSRPSCMPSASHSRRSTQSRPQRPPDELPSTCHRFALCLQQKIHISDVPGGSWQSF